MMRCLIRVTEITLTLVALIVLARLIGGRDMNPAAALFGLDVSRDSQACWHGLCPGHTSLAAAESILNTDQIAATLHRGDAQWCWQLRLDIRWQGCAGEWGALSKDPIEYIQFTPSTDNFRLGDVIALLGQPVTGEICVSPGNVWPLSSSFVVDFLTFKNGVVVGGYLPNAPNRWAGSPNMVVFYLIYSAADSYANTWPAFRVRSKNPVMCGAS